MILFGAYFVNQSKCFLTIIIGQFSLFLCSTFYAFYAIIYSNSISTTIKTQSVQDSVFSFIDCDVNGWIEKTKNSSSCNVASSEDDSGPTISPGPTTSPRS